MKIKRIVSILVVLAFGTILTLGAVLSPKTSEADADELVGITFNISICGDTRVEDNDALVSGFRAALEDKIGKDHLNYYQQTISGDGSAINSAAKAAGKNTDVIFTVGKKMLTSVAAITEEIPIVSSGVMDYRSVLKLTLLDDSTWDKTTGRNITGVTSRPSIVEQMSLLIEATPELETVALLYNPEDTDAIYQNEIMEKYLTQAGIPWKEFALERENASTGGVEESSPVIILPVKSVIPSAKEGIIKNVRGMGKNSIVGINNPSSARTPKESENWVEKYSENEDQLMYICDQASVIFIPYGSQLLNMMDKIGAAAEESGTVTVGGDIKIGQYTLVSMYFDSYELGYSAGEKAAKILLDENVEVGSMKIGSISGDECVKIYNAEIADIYNRSFPKSFSEISEYSN